MSGGLLALLDDVVALTKLTAATLDDAAAQAVKASAKAAGVVIDDAAVTPRYVTGLAAQRELPIVGRIAVGSLKNKLLFLLPAALLLSAFLPQAITPLLMLGGLYLCFEGYEKVHHMLGGAEPAAPSVKVEPSWRRATRRWRTRRCPAPSAPTSFCRPRSWPSRSPPSRRPISSRRRVVLAAVAVFITVAVYGVVALIVKADDIGVQLAQRRRHHLRARRPRAGRTACRRSSRR